ncbi:MAG TPA: hypothetical protein DEB18_01555 [Leeuwenhoekiella sp.]|nr:hypothetical protein [Leeuwenhoekiella sp.]
MSWMKRYKKKFDIFKVILEKEDPIIVEIGAHYGEDSVRFTETFEKSTIYCFEPDPRNIAIFKKHVDNSRIKLFECALSNEEGTAEFFQSYQDYAKEQVPDKYDWISKEDYEKHKLNNSGSSSLKKGYQHTLNETITVQTKRFDNWMVENDISQIDLAWIDVQGAEAMVIEGMGNEIYNVGFIWIEYGELNYEGGLSRADTITLLAAKGFKPLKDFHNTTTTGDLLFYNTSRK